LKEVFVPIKLETKTFDAFKTLRYLHVLGDDEDGPVLGADAVQLDQVVVLQLRHHLRLLNEVVL
jgi:hypothetical protein